ncbi:MULTISPECIES: DUF4148 domain-containing protein [unclassified Cupriavidus]|uniref:DUF4148 domain-containing protein n=1 Tax=Cupriavidus sp. H19C3 TaxID=3241603 RepID=UPI003BF77B11
MRSVSLKHLVSVAVVAAAASVSFAANAADVVGNSASAGPAPVTHASLMKELQALRDVGYDMSDDKFPESLERAQRKLEAKRRGEPVGSVQ